MFNNVQIQTITGCTRLCPWCPNSKLKPRKKKMNIDLYRKIINQLAELDYEGMVSIYLMNEPLLDDNLRYKVQYAKKLLKDCHTNISTNGDLINSSRDVLNLLNSGLDRLSISCYNDKAFNKFITYKSKNIVVTNFNEERRKGFYNRGGNIDINGKTTNNAANTYCDRPFKCMYIDYLGRAILCCSDYKKEVIMGDVRKERLIDIWNNKKYEHYRTALSKKDRSSLALCRSCDYQKNK